MTHRNQTIELPVKNHHSPTRQTKDLSGLGSVRGANGKSRTQLLTDPLDDELVALIWRRMIILYDSKFTSKMGLGIDDNGFLTEAASVWGDELSGVELPDLKHGFSQLRLNYPDWPPSVLEFRSLCLSGKLVGVPGLDEIVSILVTVSVRQGSLSARYKHPLALSISKSVDMFALRTASTVIAKSIVKPIYENYMAKGWEEWPAHAHDVQQCIDY